MPLRFLGVLVASSIFRSAILVIAQSASAGSWNQAKERLHVATCVDFISFFCRYPCLPSSVLSGASCDSSR